MGCPLKLAEKPKVRRFHHHLASTGKSQIPSGSGSAAADATTEAPKETNTVHKRKFSEVLDQGGLLQFSPGTTAVQLVDGTLSSQPAAPQATVQRLYEGLLGRAADTGGLAAYNGLLKRKRRATHRQVAEALERLFPERIDELLPHSVLPLT